MKLYKRLADAFTPLAKGINSEYANQNAYDSISIHGGSGFIMEYKCQRLYRDARIFSIYEGTTQLQVVAAVRYITNGTYLSIMKEMLESEVCDCMKRLKSSCSKPYHPIRRSFGEGKSKRMSRYNRLPRTSFVQYDCWHYRVVAPYRRCK